MTIESTGEGQGGCGTVVFRGGFVRVRRGLRKEFAEAPDPEPIVPVATEPMVARPAKVAVLLAFAHHVQRMIDDGRVRDRAEAARRLGITRARVSQVLDLLMLAPDLQERILCVPAGDQLTERSLRAVVRYEMWAEQRSSLATLATHA